MNIDESFAAVSHAFPRKAEFQGQHFAYAHRSDVTLIETKKTAFEPCGTCAECGQQRGTKHRRFYYWIMVDGHFQLIHAALDSRLKSMKTIGESIPGFNM